MKTRTVQNILPMGLMFIVGVLYFSGLLWILLPWSLLVLAGAMLSGLYYIFKRELKDGRIKNLNVSSFFALLSWIWFAAAAVLLWANPDIYGVDLASLVPMIINIGGSCVLAMIFTTTALLVTARK